MGTNRSLIEWTLPKKKKASDKLKKYRRRQETTKHERFDTCAGPLKSKHNAIDIWVYCPDKYLTLGKYSFSDWVKFINKIPFTCYYEGTEYKSWGGRSKRECHVVKIKTEDYPPKGNHLLAAHSIIRYSYSYLYEGIARYAMEFHEKRNDLSPLEALIIAHYINPGHYDEYYGLVQDRDIRDKIFCYPRCITGIKRKLLKSSINSSFTNTSHTKRFKTRPNKDLDKFLKEIKWD